MRIALVLLAAVLTVAPAPAQTSRLTITNATVVDVVDGTLRRGATVVIESGRVLSVGPSTETPRGEVVDATSLYVIPGLWDMHTHAYFGWPAEFGDTYVLPMFIAKGITGIRDMGSSLDAVLHAREEVAAHRLVGPRMVVSGPMLDGPHASYAAAIKIATPEDARKAVDMLKSRGVDFIKIQSGVPHDAYLAAADEARKAGIEFEGHVPDAVRAPEAVAAGQRTFEHLIGIFEASTPDEDGVWQCPTLFWERGQWLVDVIDFTRDPDIACTPTTWLNRKYPSMQRSILASMDADPLAVRERFVQHELDIVKKLHAAKVPFLAGTDTPAGVDVTPGISLHLELQRFVAAGFTPLEALQTATINPARFYGMNERPRESFRIKRETRVSI